MPATAQELAEHRQQVQQLSPGAEVEIHRPDHKVVSGHRFHAPHNQTHVLLRAPGGELLLTPLWWVRPASFVVR
jgi:hypothetical protein